VLLLVRFDFQLLHQWSWKRCCAGVPVHPDPDVVLEELRENRQDGRGAVSPAS
jgi:hypothetical protein